MEGELGERFGPRWSAPSPELLHREAGEAISEQCLQSKKLCGAFRSAICWLLALLRDPPKPARVLDPFAGTQAASIPTVPPKPARPAAGGLRSPHSPPTSTSGPTAPLQLISPHKKKKSVAGSDPCPDSLSHALRLSSLQEHCSQNEAVCPRQTQPPQLPGQGLPTPALGHDARTHTLPNLPALRWARLKQEEK